MSREVCLRCKRQYIAVLCQQTFENIKYVDITRQCFALLPQVNFPTNNLNFHIKWRWWDQIQAIFLNLFFFKTYSRFFGFLKKVTCIHETTTSSLEDSSTENLSLRAFGSLFMPWAGFTLMTCSFRVKRWL